MMDKASILLSTVMIRSNIFTLNLRLIFVTMFSLALISLISKLSGNSTQLCLLTGLHLPMSMWIQQKPTTTIKSKVNCKRFHKSFKWAHSGILFRSLIKCTVLRSQLEYRLTFMPLLLVHTTTLSPS